MLGLWLVASCGGNDRGVRTCTVTLGGDATGTRSCAYSFCVTPDYEIIDMYEPMVLPGGSQFRLSLDHPKTFASGQTYGLDDLDPMSTFTFSDGSKTYAARHTLGNGAVRDAAESISLSLLSLTQNPGCENTVAATLEVSLVEISGASPSEIVGPGRVTAVVDIGN
jgi:hypothetical protein